MRLPGLLREIVRPHQALLVAAVACVLAATAAGLSVPLLFRDLVDRITVTGDLTLLQQLALLGLGVFVLRSVFLYGQIHLNFTFAHRATADLRDLLFSRVLRWPVDRLGGWHSAEVMSRALQDTQLVHTHLLIGLVDFVATGVQLLGTVVMLFVLDWRLASATFAILPGTALLARHFGAQIQQTSALAQQRVAELATRVRDVIAGARVVRAFVQETREERRFSEENRRLLREQLRIGRLVALEVSAMSLATAVGLIVFLWVGGQLVAARLMTPGELVAFIAYVAMAIEPGVSLTRLYSHARQAAAALERVEEILRVPVVEEPRGARDLPQPLGEVVFEDVWLAYEPGRWALRGVTFHIRPGEHVALVGPSGAGKSSLVNLLLRFYDPTRGRVTVGGVDLREVRTESLRQRVAYVPQETVLFAGTVRDNIAYGRPDASLDEVVRAAVAANADGFIRQLPRGYDTPLDEAALTLSGGQRQRIAIARALLTDPEFIILDEATSSLDSESEALVQEAIERLMTGRTALVIAHRLSTVRRAHRIVVLAEGRVVQEGTYDSLMASGGLFRALAEVQLLPEPARR
ncbi:MAG: ABC transporter ATP-binding protein [Armatimonadota bacterium]|nr:ABC transporter ATP-binding protein [Armatimonadota bacterium]MDR7386387.1 ABC transporter ATP-binding protein [Armatimonadota bacterium]MDR7389361.1 ABC transporter ATP-binding protein [Armatimonadota bacterium]MDR7392405.1 ABC transporter ATP-binding protein [Armatimonadota bacterium]MDR7394282.1 ABC transporter ATP-binding protein [Armatimonadota bacterium]